MKISLAIPNYQNLETLQPLLEQVKNLGFYKIFVLDGGSDKKTVTYLETVPYIELRKSTKRLLPTENRNRMLDEEAGDWILFLDSDMRILSTNFVDALESLVSRHPKARIFGGLIRSHTDEPMWFNYGKFLSPLDKLQLDIWLTVAIKFWNEPEQMAWVREHVGPLSYNLWEPTEKRVDWLSEGVFCVNTELFHELHGFDEKFVMYHEGPDLCKRTWDMHYEVVFSPSLEVKHLGTDNVGSRQRETYKKLSTAYWYEKHYGIPHEIYNKLS